MNTIKKTAVKQAKRRIYAPLTLARFVEINDQIKAHENNIAYLQSIAITRKTLRNIHCKRLIRAFQSTPEDERRLPKTLENLQQQIQLLVFEREVLERYGR